MLLDFEEAIGFSQYSPWWCRIWRHFKATCMRAEYRGLDLEKKFSNGSTKTDLLVFSDSILQQKSSKSAKTRNCSSELRYWTENYIKDITMNVNCGGTLSDITASVQAWTAQRGEHYLCEDGTYNITLIIMWAGNDYFRKNMVFDDSTHPSVVKTAITIESSSPEISSSCFLGSW